MPSTVIFHPDEFEAEMLRRVLLERGYQVKVVNDSRHLLGSLATHQPDAVILGDRRTDPEYLDAARWIRERLRHLDMSVVALVATGDIEVAARAYDAGADLVLFTPLDLQLMVSAVASTIRRRAEGRSAATPAPRIVDNSA